jgi:hypothetical protein
MTLPRASFTWRLDAGDLLLIIDENRDGPSVTNNIEAVLAHIAALGIDLDKKWIVYRDSEGRWDGVATRESKFAHFLIIRAWSSVEAVKQWPATSLDD